MDKFMDRMSNYGFLLIPVIIAVLVLLLNHYGCDINAERDPAYAEAYTNRGAAYYRKGEIDKAIADYTTAIKMNPEQGKVYKKRGAAYYRKGVINKAIADYTSHKS